jgi:endonuclease G
MRLRLIVAAALGGCALLTTPAFAACEGEYYGGAEPRALAISIHVRDLCYEAFAVGHSGTTHTPLWSAEHLTAIEIEEAQTLSRHDRFHAEPALPRAERAELSDYAHSGFDRGHLAPSGDMPTPQAQAQSFTLANMTPQAPALNRGLWEEIEVATRNLATDHGELYVVTGPVFERDIGALNGRVRVPSAMFKAIYDPSRREAGAYVADNAAGGGYRVLSIAQLRALIGVDVFPTLPEAIKAQAMRLPPPQRRETQSRETPSLGRQRPAGILTAVAR